MTNLLLKLASGMIIKAGWTSSVMSLSSFSAEVVILEECDKVKGKVSATEASVEKLAEGRGVDFGADFKIIRCTTLSGEGALGAKARQRADIFVDFLARCPVCGQLEYMFPERVDYVRQRHLFNKIKSMPSAAWYFCGRPGCGAKWTEKQRVAALVAGELRARAEGWQDREKDGLEPEHDPRPMRQYLDEAPNWGLSAALSIPALCLPTVPLCRWASDKIAGDNDTDAKHYFVNHRLDKPFAIAGGIHKSEDILRRSWGQPFGVVPSGWQCAGLYCGIDSQKGKFYYWVSAIGFAMQADGTELRPNLWQVDAGELPSVDEQGQAIPIGTVLKKLEDRVYQDEMGNNCWPSGPDPVAVWNGQWVKVKGGKHRKQMINIGGLYKIRCFFIDGRGNNYSNDNITQEVKAWCRGNPPMRRLHWGGKLTAGKSYSASFDKDYGIYIYHTDRHLSEQWFERGLSITPGDQGSIQVSADCTPVMAEHLCNVEVDHRTNRYIKPTSGRRDFRDGGRYSTLPYFIEHMNGVVQPV